MMQLGDNPSERNSLSVENGSVFDAWIALVFMQVRFVRICRELVSKIYGGLLHRHDVFDGALVALPVLECVDAFLELAGVDQ